MHAMWPIATDVHVAWVLSGCLLVARQRHAKDAARIEILFAVETPDAKETLCYTGVTNSPLFRIHFWHHDRMSGRGRKVKHS